MPVILSMSTDRLYFQQPRQLIKWQAFTSLSHNIADCAAATISHSPDHRGLSVRTAQEADDHANAKGDQHRRQRIPLDAAPEFGARSFDVFLGVPSCIRNLAPGVPTASETRIPAARA